METLILIGFGVLLVLIGVLIGLVWRESFRNKRK